MQNTKKLTILSIDPVKYALVIAIIMALMTFVMMMLMFLFMSAAGSLGGGAELFPMMSFGFVGVIVAPLIYFVFGFIFGWLGCILFNFVVQRLGGFDIEIKDYNESDLSDSII